MKTRAINPQTWLNAFHLNSAIEVTHGQRVLYCSGQTSNDAEGVPMHPGDIRAQFKLAWANLVEILAAADMQPANIVRLNFYATDVEGFMSHAAELSQVWAEACAKPASTLLGVDQLFQPNAMIEIEATAVA